jgi:tetratricopeptide (TPR) repeat protein
MLSFKRTLSLSFLLLVFVDAGLDAQSTSGEGDKRVEQLHNEAKQAQELGDVATAAAKYEEILRIAPKLDVAYNNLGALYFRQRDYAKAARVLEQGLKINPRMTSAAALLGISLFESADYARARPALEAAMKANPNDGNVPMFLAKNLIKLGDEAGAVAELQKMAARQPQNQEIFYLLSKVYMKMSEQALAKMNAIDPSSVLAHQLSAEVMESMNNYDGAVVQLKKAVDIAPRLAGNHYKLGDAFWNLSQWELATEQFKDELEIDPGNCMAQWKIGNILLQKGDSAEEALAALDTALKACPTLADAHEDRARALAKLDRNAEAVADLEAAEKVNPEDPSVHFLLAKVYRAVGRSQDAGREMQLFSKLDEAARAATAERAQEVIQNKQGAH